MKNNNKLKKLYHKYYSKYIESDKNNIKTYQDIVEKINKEKGINIQTVVIHSGEEDATFQSSATFKHLSQKNDDQKTQEAEKLKTILNTAKESKKPTGILVIVVNQKDQLQHVNGFVISGKSKQINGKPILITNKNSDAYIDFYINSLFTCIFNKFETELDKKELQQNIWPQKWMNELAEKNEAFAKDFSYIVPQTTQKSYDYTCIVDSLIFCEKMLKKNAEQFKEFINHKTIYDEENNQYTSKLPLSIMKYTQERNKPDIYFDDIIKYEYGDDKKNKELFKKLQHYTCEFEDDKGYHKHNNSSYIKLFKLLNKIDPENQDIKDIIDTYIYPVEKIKNFINNGDNIKAQHITPEAIIEYLSNDMFFKNKGNNWTRRWNGKKRRYHAFVRALKNASKNQATPEEKQNKQYLRMRDLDEIHGPLSDEIKTKIENIFKSKPTNNLEEDKKEEEVNQRKNNIQPRNSKKKKKGKGKKNKKNKTNPINPQNRQQEINNEDSKRNLKAIQEQIHNTLNQTGCGCC